MTYIEQQEAFLHVLVHLHFFYLALEYYLKYPLIAFSYTQFYLSCLCFLELFYILMSILKFDTILNYYDFLMVYSIGCSLIYGVINVTFKKKQSYLLQYTNLNEIQESTQNSQLFLEDLYEKYILAEKNQGSYLQVMGILNLHQEQCLNEECPCIVGVLGNNLEDKEIDEIDQDSLTSEEQIREKILIKEQVKMKGVYLYSQTSNPQRFRSWFHSFIDFHLIRILKYLENTKRTQLLQQVSVKYWYFQMKLTRNPIKACSTSKITLSGIQDPSLYFCIIERGLTKQIKNRIMEKDKAASYSYKLKIADEAKHISELENVVHSETQIEECKTILIMVLKSKITWLETLIDGYKNINQFFNDTLNLMKSVNFIEKEIQQNLRSNRKNIQYKKMYSIIKARLVNDPVFAEKIEQEIYAQRRNDAALDSTTISSISILSGKVGSIVASFRNNELDGKILSFSQRFPELLGYDYQEFKEFKNLRVVMPKVVADIHEVFISKLINSGKPSVIRRYRDAFSIDKNGHLFLIKLFSNYHFQLMDQFAFSALILKLEPKVMLLLVDKFGHICGINKIFQERLGCMGIDPLYFNKLHQGLFFPQMLNFYERFDTYGAEDDLNFVKQNMQFPKPFEIEVYMEEFLILYTEFQKKKFKSDAHKFKELQKFFSHFYNNVCSDLNLINIGDPKLDTTIQMLPEKIPTGTGGLIELFVVVVHQWKEIDEQKSSSLGMSLGATDVDKNSNSMSKLQQYKGNTYVSSLNMSKQLDRQQTDNKNNYINNLNIAKGLVQNDSKCEYQQNPAFFDQLLDQENLQNQSNMQLINQENQQKNTMSIDYNSYNQNQTTQDLSQNISKDCGDQQNIKESQKQKNRFHCIEEEEMSSETEKEDEAQQINNFSENDDNEYDQNNLSLQMGITNHSNDVQFGDEFAAEKGNAQASVSSSIQSVEVGALKLIKIFTKDKSYPKEIISLYLTFFVQIIIFFSVIIIFQIFMQQYFEQIRKAIAQLTYPLYIQSPISILLSISQFFIVKNYSYDDTINLEYYNKYNLEDFLYQEAKDSYNILSFSFDELINTKIDFQFQKNLQNRQIENVYFQNYITGEIVTQPLKYTEVIRSYTESLYSMTFEKSSLTDYTLNNYDNYYIVNNYDNIRTSISSLSQNIETDIAQYKNKIQNMNLSLFIISLILIICSFVFIIPAFNNLKLRIERICQVVSRMTEKEAFYEIHMNTQIQALLSNHREPYLQCVFTNYDINKWDKNIFKSKQQIQQIKNGSAKLKSVKSKQTTKSASKIVTRKKGKNESGILTDRINESKLNYNAIYVILSILFLLSISFFISVFVYVGNYKSYYDPFIKSFQGFIKSSNQFGIVNSAEIISYVYFLYQDTGLSDNNYKSSIIDKIIEDQEYILQQSQEYFSLDFNSDALGNSFDNQFQDFLHNVNVEDVCEIDKLIQNYEKKLCEQADNDLLSRGIQLAIKNVYNTVLNNDIGNWDKSSILKDIQETSFEDDFILNILLQKIFIGISEQYSIANQEIKDNFLNILLLMFLIGGITYGILFLILVAYFITNLQKDYILIKSAIQVVPYHRLAEDHTTHHLLKRIFKF